MYRVSVLYGTPKDPQAFDDYYENKHIPIARTMKGLTGWTLTKVADQDGDVTPGIYLVADLYSRTREDMDAVLSSPEGQAASADVANFATGGATFLFGTQHDVELR